MNLRVFMACFAIAALLGVSGCVRPVASPETHSAAQEILQNYSPSTVYLFEIQVSAQVEEDFAGDYLPTSYFSEVPYRIEQVGTAKLVNSTDPRSLWLFSENDTVILAHFHLSSTLHEVDEWALAIAGARSSALVEIGGLAARMVPASPGLGRAFMGPFSLGSYSVDLPNWTAPRSFQFRNNAIFPLLDRETDVIVQQEMPVATTVTIAYHGFVKLTTAETTRQELTRNPSDLEYEIEKWPNDFVPGGRIGQYSPLCGGQIMASSPCRDAWLRWTSTA